MDENIVDVPQEITPKTFSKQKQHWLIASLPEYLKKPENYEKIQRAILDAGATRHSHAEVIDWAGCTHCQRKQLDRLLFMKKLGFVNAAQYKSWQRIHETIKERVPLPKYNK